MRILAFGLLPVLLVTGIAAAQPRDAQQVAALVLARQEAQEAARRSAQLEGIARTVPIAVMTRPGYDAHSRAARAMGWLRRSVRPAAEARRWTEWRLPALVLLPMPPDPTSATGLRAARPEWHSALCDTFNPQALRDRVTRRPFSSWRSIARIRAA